jgi:Mg-chelatase subunit ChlD
MQKWIDKAKGSISRIMQEFKTKIPFQSRVRIAVVCFRDFDCGNKRIAYHNFTTHAHLIEEFIGKQLAEGGEDIPEDLLGALEAAYSLNISTKELSLLNLVIMTDAPCHGKPYHDLMWDEYSEN